MYLTNTFSLQMLRRLDFDATLRVQPIETDKAIAMTERAFETKDLVIAVSHQSTAQVLDTIFTFRIQQSRIDIQLDRADILIVFQLLVRPKEGQVFTTSELRKIIANKQFKFIQVTVL